MRRAFLLFLLSACRTPAGKDDLGGTIPSGSGLETEDTGQEPGEPGEPSSDLDGDGFDPASGDCDEDNPERNPDAPESCDGIDNNCDGAIDEGLRGTTWADSDADGFGGVGTAEETCLDAAGRVDNELDCEDSDPDIHPDGTEVCDERDNDCDGTVDEDVALTWWGDLDGDTFGDAALVTTACAPPTGYAAQPGDCDDSNATIYPEAVEVCNGQDDDCDASIDEDTPEGSSTYYLDADGDGFGDPDQPLLACELPSGASEDATDCDDSTALAAPDQPESCDGLDNDCDSLIDEAGALGGSTQYADIDGDSYGDPGATRFACTLSSGWVSRATDCDDLRSEAYPGAPEICNGLDEDCDSLIDDNPTVGTVTTYADLDGDGAGDPTSALLECSVSSGRVEDNSDCADGDEWVVPGGAELADGIDNDCDGATDEDLHHGSGADGDLTVSGTRNLSTTPSGSRSVADAIARAVTAIGTRTLTLSGGVSGFEPGDEVLVINLQGSPSAYSAVGTYETAHIESLAGSTLTLRASLLETYGESSNADLSGQTVIVQRIPNYHNVTLLAGARLTASPWNGSSGGILAFRASGALTVASTASMQVSQLGYEGGATGPSNNCDSYQGESIAGPGEGAAFGTCAAYNETYGLWANNLGGGGAHITGGGGEHAGGATPGDSWTGGSATPPEAGDVYGVADLSLLTFGSGGGGVWNGGTDSPGENPGPGGDGGGILYVTGAQITATGSSAFDAQGGTTPYWAWGTWTYGAGGGAGGSIYLAADQLDLANNAVTAAGGLGESSHIRHGGNGGVGRVRLDCDLCNGAAWGTTAATSALSAAAVPDPGFSTTP